MLGSMLGRYENSVTLSLIDIRMPGSSNNNPPKEEDDSPEFCFLKISIAGQVRKQSVVLQLNVKDCPKTCRNFSALCSSSKTTSATQPLPSYRGCDFHRIIDGFMVQSGDFEHFNGTGGFSPLYQVFDDEYLNGKHDQAGILSMANTGRNTNKSQFFVSMYTILLQERF
jgi:cyclophilin family peptidyl-prolyl cis-trans isomerase